MGPGKSYSIQERKGRLCQFFKNPRVVNAISGGVSGITTAVFVCPLDVLKTRMHLQTGSDKRYHGVAQGLARLVREEGIGAAYRGLTPTILALLPTWAIYFPVYEHCKQELAGSTLPTVFQHVLASAMAGTVNLTITNPLWVVKTRLQAEGITGSAWASKTGKSIGQQSIFVTLRSMLKREGLRGMYSGLAPSLAGVAHVAIQLPLYEFLKARAAAFRGNQDGELYLSDIFISTCLSKLVASSVTYPHEVVRSNMHVLGCGAFSGFKETISTVRFPSIGDANTIHTCCQQVIRILPLASDFDY